MSRFPCFLGRLETTSVKKATTVRLCGMPPSRQHFTGSSIERREQAKCSVALYSKPGPLGAPRGLRQHPVLAVECTEHRSARRQSQVEPDDVGPGCWRPWAALDCCGLMPCSRQRCTHEGDTSPVSTRAFG